MFELEVFEMYFKNVYTLEPGAQFIRIGPCSRFMILFILVGDTLWNHRINNLETAYDTPGMYCFYQLLPFVKCAIYEVC